MNEENIFREGKFSANMITEDNLWLADYFGNTQGETRLKNDVSYSYQWGECLEVTTLDDCHWVYECSVNKVVELDGAHPILAEIKNIQIDKKYENMDMKRIDLGEIRPTVYAPYNYFSIGGKLGEMGEWKERLLQNSEGKR